MIFYIELTDLTQNKKRQIKPCSDACSPLNRSLPTYIKASSHNKIIQTESFKQSHSNNGIQTESSNYGNNA